MDEHTAVEPALLSSADGGADFQPSQIAGWQSEVAIFLTECLDEVQAVSELLRSAQSPATPAPVTATPTPENPPRAAQPPTAPATPVESPFIPEADAEAEGDFNARLANLKKMLAEKLTDSET